MAGTVVKGSITIDFDALDLEVKLSFRPDKNGDEWNAESILKLLGERRVSPMPSPRAVDEILQKIGKSKEPTSATIVRGTAPVPSIGEQVAWIDNPIPDDLAELIKESIAHASAPELYRTHTEKIQRETIVKKPGALPFLPPKEEVVVSWDKRETRERVYVDPTVQEIFYVEKGVKIGTTTPPRPGKPGKNVFGKPVSPPSSGESVFLLGSGIDREKAELRTAHSGILRVGTNWADILPLARPSWKVEKGVDGATIYLHFEPGDKRLTRPLARDVLAAAVDLGAAEADLIEEADVEEFLEKASRSGESVEAVPLSIKRDAEVRVDISPDKLRATLYMRKGVAGASPLELKAVSEAIRASRVRGFKADTVKADILAFFHGTDTEFKDYVLVEGTAPTRGKDREIQLAVAFVTEEYRNEIIQRIISNPRADIPINPDSFFPATEANEIAYIEKDACIGMVSHPPEGTSGVDVFGTTLPGLPGNDPDIRLFDGLHMTRNEIISDFEGLLLVRKDESSFTARVIPYKDCRIDVHLSADAMEASLDLEREVGAGKPLTAEAVNAALAEAGITRGIDGMAMAEALREAFEEGRCEDVLVAKGEPPVAGGGTALKWLIPLSTGKGVTIKEDGHADFKNQDHFTAVSEGTAIAEVSRQGAEGRPGFDVTGKILSPEKGESASVFHDESVREEKIEGGVRLFATRTGELQFDGTMLKINVLHLVKGDVGVSTGNINFPGEIRVGGKVNPGFAVIGGADVLISGTAEASLVSAGGRAVVGQGIIGAGKGVVRARRGIDAGFVEQATLLAVEDVRVKNGCLQCQIKTNGKLRLLGEKGHMIGGICRARLGVESANIGSERGTRTEISFGQDYLVMDQIEVTERETEKIKKALADLERRLKKLEGTGAPLDAARAEKVRLMKLLEKYGLRLFTLREKFEEHHQSEINIRGTIFPGVVMESHGRYYEVKQKRDKVIFIFDRELGRIREK